jgi:enamine deaminase RidA (YjgF/YER057c/UK114 family)
MSKPIARRAKKIIGDDVLPASTLLIVDGLASPEFLIEIEATAAK